MKLKLWHTIPLLIISGLSRYFTGGSLLTDILTVITCSLILYLTIKEFAVIINIERKTLKEEIKTELKNDEVEQ